MLYKPARNPRGCVALAGAGCTGARTMPIARTGTSEGLGTRKPEILVVEDNFLTASEICDAVRHCGFNVAGAVGRLDRGLEFLVERHVDGAVVDINLNDTQSFPLCVELE